MSETQIWMIRFAQQHDWGYDARANADGSITVGETVIYPDGRQIREYTTVKSMNELRIWAGY